MDLVTDILGVMGFAILIIALIFNGGRNTKNKIILYYVMQLVGAALLGVYAYLTASIIFLVLEVVWVFVALYFLYQNISKLRSLKKDQKKEIKKAKQVLRKISNRKK